MRARLARYKEDWGNADAPLGPDVDGDLGRWCKVQRQLRDAGRLAASRHFQTLPGHFLEQACPL